MKEVLAGMHAALSQDASLVSLLGDASKVRRARQGREVEPPCVTLEVLSEKRFVEGTDRIREAEARVSAWASEDRSCSDICEAVIAALDEADLSDEAIHCCACAWDGIGGEPRYDDRAEGYKRELSFKVIYRIK